MDISRNLYVDRLIKLGDREERKRRKKRRRKRRRTHNKMRIERTHRLYIEIYRTGKSVEKTLARKPRDLVLMFTFNAVWIRGVSRIYSDIYEATHKRSRASSRASRASLNLRLGKSIYSDV